MATLTLLIVVSAAQFAWPPLADGERPILMELYRATGGDKWKDRRGWGSDESPCEWRGIICEQTFEGGKSGTTVRLIDLSGNGLSGTIPDSLAALRGLKGLDVSRNALRGKFPEPLLDRWDRGALELSIEGNAFSNLPVEARVDVRNPHLLCGDEANWTAVATEAGRIRYESEACTPPVTSRKTHCLVREGRGTSLVRLGRALEMLGYQRFTREYSDEQFLTTHSTSVTTTIRYGDGSEKQVTTSGSQEPLDVWTAQQLLLSHVRFAAWESEKKSPKCALLR